ASTYALNCPASCASCSSSTFSAFCSPDRDRLNEPVKTTSSATTTLACMKSCTVPSPQGVDGLALKSPFITCSSSGSFHATFPSTRHWYTTPPTCGAST